MLAEFARIYVHRNVHKGMNMGLIRIGEKVINRHKIESSLDRILELRAQGLSQQDVANRLGLERSFISRLEGLGEVRQGARVAVVGFPVANKDEIQQLLEELGVECVLLMTDRERWDFVSQKTGVELLNAVMGLMMELRTYDVVVVLGSDLRIRIAQALLDKEVIPVKLGDTPIATDQYVDPGYLREILTACRSGG
ncbi:MAG: transcriptional regulator [Syntrophomonadaceae bacterium]|nr:transcriptional regulator [Syntrophomonadaceae bacterium]